MLAVGGNDFKYRGDDELLINYEQILKTVPATDVTVIVAVLPVEESVIERRRLRHRSNRATAELNRRLSWLCIDRAGVCRFVEDDQRLTEASGNLRPDMHQGDGIHLSPKGYRVITNAIGEVLAALTRNDKGLSHG